MGAVRRTWLAGWTLALILVVHLAATTRIIAPASLLGSEPFYSDDYVLHFARAELVAEELPRTWRLWLYDPTTMAGYPLGATVFDLDNVGTATAMALLPFDAAHEFKLIVWACLLLVPLACWLAARTFGLGSDEAVAAAAAAVVVSATTITFRIGMYADFAGGWLAVLLVALAYRHLAHPSGGSYATLVAVGAVGLWWHALVGVLVLVPCAVLVMLAARTEPRRMLLQAMLVAGAIGLLCTPWLVPFLRFAPTLGSDYPSPFFQTGSLASAWGLLAGGGGWHVFLLALGGLGVVVLVSRAEWRLALPLGLWAALLLLAALQGSRSAIVARLQPLRFLVPLAFVLCPLAGIGAAALVRGALRRVGAAEAAAVALAPLLFAPHLLMGLRAFAPFPPIAAELPTEAKELVAWLRATTDPGARVLVEDRLHVERPRRDREVPDHPWFGSHLLALLPRLVDRELIGGPYPEMPIRPHVADLSSGVFFGHAIETWPIERFAAQLTRYNIGTIVAWSSATRAYLVAHPDVVEAVGARDIFHVFRSRQPRSAFLVGAGVVRARPNALEVDAAGPGRVVLAYHWYPGMCSDPPLHVEPHDLPGLAMPFIAVDHGDQLHFVLRPARNWRGECS